MKQLDYFFFKILENFRPHGDTLWCFACWPHVAIPLSEYLEEKSCFIYLSVGVT